MRVLLVEDEPEMAAALRVALQRHDIVLDYVDCIGAVDAAIAPGRHDILLDRRLPDGDGMTLVPRLRRALGGVAIIMLTAQGGVSDRIQGLDAGADDYLAKPFSVEELLARLRAVLRRPSEMASKKLCLGRLVYDCGGRVARVDDQALELPRRELLVLETLLKRAGRTVMRETLEDAVYGFSDEVQSNALDAHISRLRRKLADSGSAVEIHVIKGVGYLLRAVE